ncbi:MAG: chemotaxis protein CheW [Oscillospiraceae bacterium]|jgi:purine-binding chemotaxis protein CheW|nr:chemotaxis protein CheW [Oscillospiraceae bacterium]
MNNEGFEAVNVAVDGNNDEMKGKYLTFWTDDQLFGVPIKDVVQIVGMQKITQIPEYPDYAKGIINLRGTIVPLIDVRLRLGKPEKEYNDRTCIIVTSVNNSYFGFIVDEVEEVTDISDDMISPPPKLSGDTVNKYLTGIARMNDKLVLTIDTAKILGEEEFDALLQSAE